MIQAFLILLVYIVGPIALLVWAAKRFRAGGKLTAQEVLGVLGAVLLLGLFAYTYTWNLTDKDAADAARLTEELSSRYEFPPARFHEGPALVAVPQSRYIEVRVYGVTARDQQERVLELARQLRRQITGKPLVVRFIDEELWLENEDGSRRHQAELEVAQRTARVE